LQIFKVLPNYDLFGPNDSYAYIFKQDSFFFFPRLKREKFSTESKAEKWKICTNITLIPIQSAICLKAQIVHVHIRKSKKKLVETWKTRKKMVEQKMWNYHVLFINRSHQFMEQTIYSYYSFLI